MANPLTDIALLRTDSELGDIASIEIADISTLKTRDTVFVLGFPFGMPYTETQGIISNPQQLMDSKHYIQTDAAVNPGNSGGPVVNSEGKVVGITTCKFNNADNIGFALPADILQQELEYSSQNPENKYAVHAGLLFFMK